MTTESCNQLRYASTLPLSPRTHQTALREIQESRFARIRSIFAAAFPAGLSSGMCVATTGSDGRGEAGQTTPFELVLLYRSRSPDANRPHSTEEDLHLSDSRSDSAPTPLNVSALMNTSIVSMTSPLSHLDERNHTATPGLTGSAWTSPPDEEGEISETTEKIRQIIAEHSKIFFPALITHDLSTDHPLKTPIKDQQHPQISPGRPLESLTVFGDPEMGQAYWESAAAALWDAAAKDRHRFQKNVLKPAIAELERCVTGESLSPVNYTMGALLYDGARNFSVKYVLLRPIQYQLIYHLMHIKGLPGLQKTEAIQLLKTMPHSVLDRIPWMKAQGLLPDIETPQLCSAYNTALFWYGKSQTVFEQQRHSINVDPSELHRVADTILDFAASPPISLEPRKQRKSH